jgi:nicotinate-nucleotide pyrophosphorylase (carboxylating)
MNSGSSSSSTTAASSNNRSFSATASSQHAYAHLLPPTFQDDIIRWIKDDCPSTDIGGFVVGEKVEEAHLFCKTSGMLAGVPFAQAVFDHLKLQVEWQFADGCYIDVNQHPNKKAVVAIVSGKCRHILLAERTALNILSRASGVATEAYKAATIARKVGWHGYVAGTRKTTPGFKMVEKYALVVGGASTHRQDLSQMVMLKDNHIWSAGNITAAVKKARQAAGFSMKIEVECQSVEEAIEAASAGADIVMLDNFTHETIGPAASRVKEVHPTVLVEASGGISESSMHLYMHPSVDVISRGSLTQGYPCLDFSLKVAHS